MFGLCIIASISGGNMAKGLICGFLGILTATVGIDSVTSYIRFTDNANLLSGIQYIPVTIGLFAMSQAFEAIEDIYSTDEIDASVTRLLPTKEDPDLLVLPCPDRVHTVWCDPRTVKEKNKLKIIDFFSRICFLALGRETGAAFFVNSLGGRREKNN